MGIGGKSSGSRKADNYGNGMKTLRLRSKGAATVEVVIWHAYILDAVCIVTSKLLQTYLHRLASSSSKWKIRQHLLLELLPLHPTTTFI